MEIKNVVSHIVLPFLPAKTLVRFRSVSKDWDLRIRSPFLAHQQSYFFNDLSGFFCQHYNRNPTFLTLDDHAYGVPTPALTFLPEPVDIISSCSGLLLCQERARKNSYYICNPATEEWRELPQPELYHGIEAATILAFEPSPLNMSADYHLISAVPMLDQPVILFELYTSETRSWRVLATIFVESGDLSFTGSRFYMNGIAYWGTTAGKVLAFGLKNEVYEVISLPPDAPTGGILSQIQGELCYISASIFSGNCSIKIYAGMDLRLIHVTDVTLEQVPDRFPWYRVLPCLEGSVVMILVEGLVCSYRLSDGKIEVVGMVGEGGGGDNYLPYVNSLVRVA
ncbi:F-box protein At5g07610-like [Sesamum indicum]|uniref:F-box protein At5g07610-like n=1 Tax=Sesamum indicum TaxID=4182 RepID=A0A6I9TZ42_SESIN|nr:F-box protein At5g07610-like [Sesamum indicum]XP_020552562.1 F-box protein At5g07610-like [Sesamum indicum]XP_020552563.1 F-box protein At5g07610-like [Sesamum indicum]XP_020552564.1 F-box protein At5g07610-like [Sesamum indicum]XP_020552565.1 F-box protein At5g07610-like [Sesamum indicum]